MASHVVQPGKRPARSRLDARRSVLVVGGSIAGVRSAVALRRLGFEGRITIIGEEHEWPPFDRPPLSKGVLTGEVALEQARIRVPDDLGVDVVLGRRAVALDVSKRCVVLDDGSQRFFDGLVIATGARPRTLPGTEGIGCVRVLRTAADAEWLSSTVRSKRRIAVVGAGFIGTEVASSCASLGAEVHVIDIADRPLLPLGRLPGEYVRKRQREIGMTLHYGRGINSLDGDESGASIRLNDGIEIAADVVVVGIGVRPACDWLAGSGLTLDDGVLCDAACVAVGGDGDIVAAGDVARWQHPGYGRIRIEHWTNAGEQAAHAAHALLAGAETAGAFAPVPYFWSNQLGIKMQFVGVADTDDIEVVSGTPASGSFVVAYRRGDEVRAALCVNSPREVPRWSKLIAEHLDRSPISRR